MRGSVKLLLLAFTHAVTTNNASSQPGHKMYKKTSNIWWRQCFMQQMWLMLKTKFC